MAFTLLCTVSDYPAVAGDEGVYRLGEVVVSAPESAVETSGTVRVVTAAEIEARRARTLDEAIELLPGVIIRTGGDGTPRVDLRGFRTRHVLLLLDGSPFNSTYDGQFDPTFIPVEMIAEIRMTTGGSSVLYGPGGNGGVINVITKKGYAGAHVYAGLEAGDTDAYLVRGNVSGGNGKVDGFVSGSFQTRNGYPLSDDFHRTVYERGGMRDNADFERYGFFGNVGYYPDGETMLGLSMGGFRGGFGKPGLVNYTSTDPFAKKPKYDRMDDQEGYNVQVAASHDFSGSFGVRGWAYYNTLDTVENRYDDANYNTQKKNSATGAEMFTEVAGVNLQGTYTHGDLAKATLGFLFESDGWESTSFRYVKVDKKNVKTYTRMNSDYQLYTVAAECELTPLDDAGVVLGYAHHFQQRRDACGEDDFSYLLSGHYDPFDGTRIFASHQRKVRFPSLKQLYEPGAGDPALTAERSLHYEAGVSQRLPLDSSVGVTGFIIDAKDYIEKDWDGMNRNYDRYRISGVETTVETRPVEGLMFRAGYTWLATDDRSGMMGERDELQYRPRNKVTVEGRYTAFFGLTAYASFMHVGGQYFYDGNDVEQNALNNYSVVDAKLTQSLLDDVFRLYVGADNLFDEDYEQSYGLPQPGRFVYGGVEVRTP